MTGGLQTGSVSGRDRLLAVVPVRAGVLPLGADEAVAEAGGRALLIGEGTTEAAARLSTAGEPVRAVDAGAFAPGRWAAGLAPLLEAETVLVLPASPDGRDLAPRLAAALGRPLLAVAQRITAERAWLIRHGGLAVDEVALAGPVVATLQPGARGVPPPDAARPRPPLEALDVDLPPTAEVEVLEVLPPDPCTIDLSEAERIVAGGQGVGSAQRFALLGTVATALGASLGATRVATDAGWAPHERQIGTTGVTVNPRLYIAIGISGAVQHVAGLGDPEHIIAVNLDPSCPMMALADLAIVTDAPALIDHLAARLGLEAGAGSRQKAGHGSA